LLEEPLVGKTGAARLGVFIASALRFLSTMQLQNTKRSARRSVSPKSAAKARGQSSNRNANTSRSVENATRSYRQTAARGDNDGSKSGRRSKKDNRRTSAQRSQTPANKRRAPVGRGRNVQAKRRSPQGAQRAKELKGMTTGNARPRNSHGGKGSSEKRAHSRRQ
jgi:hypothetical protein